MSKGDDIIILQSSTDFSKAAEQLLNKTEMILISQYEISSRISQVIEWNLIKSLSLGLHENIIQIVTCNDGFRVHAFKHSFFLYITFIHSEESNHEV